MEQLEEAIQINQLQQKKLKKEILTKPELFLKIEKFIRKKQLIGYGGTAINLALPKEIQFYHPTDIPDYDFFSKDAIRDIKELADLLFPYFPNTEVKPAMFQGTYKLFVNYLPLVDMTQIEEDLFDHLLSSSFQREKIHYVPYNYLRMSMYQELSRPLGDVSRWTKVYQRLELLNQYQPFIIRKCQVKPILDAPKQVVQDMVSRLQNYVILGDYAMYYWQDLFPKQYRYKQSSILFVLSETIEEIRYALHGMDLRFTYYQNKLIQVYEVHIEGFPILYVILTDACANYNVYRNRKIASYDTTLHVYFSLSFTTLQHLSKPRLLSYCYLLLQIQEDHPLMRRFHLPCYGKQTTFEDIRKRRAKLFKRKQTHFFHYHPKKLTKKQRKNQTLKS